MCCSYWTHDSLAGQEQELALCVCLLLFCVSVCAEVNLRHEPELQEGYDQLQRTYTELEDIKSRFDRSYAVQNEKMAVRLTG